VIGQHVLTSTEVKVQRNPKGEVQSVEVEFKEPGTLAY
jgi:hypothetical protein